MSRLSKDLYVCTTPFGSPVVPEVNKISAFLSKILFIFGKSLRLFDTKSDNEEKLIVLILTILLKISTSEIMIFVFVFSEMFWIAFNE